MNISVILPVYNAASTLAISLDSLKKQTVKVSEIIIVDNKSQDNSIDIIKQYQEKNKDLSIILLRQKETSSVASSYNLALKKSKGNFILAMHSDSSLPTRNELKKLITPLLKNEEVVATYSHVILPKKIWLSYNFWEKCQSCRVVGKKIPGMNGKFDCYRKTALLKLNGFDDVNFDKYGDGNDADVYYRFKKIGRVILTKAQVIHLHYLKSDYSLSMWIEKRKNMSITAGRLLKMYGLETDLKGIVSFLLRPFLVFLLFIPKVNILGIFFALAFSILYTSKMFTTVSTVRNPRIIILPFVNIFLIYFESFWILYTLFTHKT
ncbi:MAG: glycosyltransferase family A protein, partial [Candidatus Levybacteria bacterium]|nr:glycosyltransferase family A protein [Candidatus Levybacteria bacterium]